MSLKHLKHRPVLLLTVLFAIMLTMDVSVMVIYKHVEVVLHGDKAYYFKVFLQPLVWLALAISCLHLWLWTRILNLTDLSVAYPICSASYPLTMLAGMLIFHEHLGPQVWAGAFFIVMGVILIGTSSTETETIVVATKI